MNRSNPMYDNGDYIQSANLCVESFSPIAPSKNFKKNEIVDGKVINTYDIGKTHVCNLISINVGKILNNEKLLEKSIRYAVRMLNQAILCTKAPTAEANYHNDLYKVIGIGLLGAHDYLAYNKLSYLKEEAWLRLEQITEKISYYSLDESCELSKEYGTFKAFEQSSFKKGIYLGKTGKELQEMSVSNLDWISLLEKAKQGTRNMMLMGFAPNTSCQSGYNKVLTKNGVTTIYEILQKENIDIELIETKHKPEWIYLKSPIKVPTYQGDDVVNRIWWNGHQNYVDIEFEDGKTYQFTLNHKLLVKRSNGIEEWVECGNLTGDEEIVSINVKSIKIKKITKHLDKTIPTYDFEVSEKHHYLLDNGCVSHNTGILQYATASYLPVFSKFYYDSMAKMNTPFAPRYLKDRFWYYNESWTIDPKIIVELTTRMQKWVDAGMSMELVVNTELFNNIALLSNTFRECFKQGLKAIYYGRFIDPNNHSDDNRDTCVSCAN